MKRLQVSIGVSVLVGLLVAVVVDPVAPLGGVGVHREGAIVAVDLTPGASFSTRTIISDNSTPNTDNPFHNPRHMVLDSDNNRLLLLDLDAVIAVLDVGCGHGGDLKKWAQKAKNMESGPITGRWSRIWLLAAWLQ